MRELMSYLPENYRNSRETAAFQGALQPEVDGLWLARDDFLAQLNPYTATWALDLWEDALGLSPGVGLELELRRRQVAAKLQGRAPTTAETLKNVAETALGIPVRVIEVFEAYRIELELAGWLLPMRDGAARLRAQLLDMLPAHLDFQLVIPLLLGLPITTRAGPRRSETALTRFQGGPQGCPLHITSSGGGAISTTRLPLKEAKPEKARLPTGAALGPRMSRTDPNCGLPDMTAHTGSRMTAARRPHGAADYEGG